MNRRFPFLARRGGRSASGGSSGSVQVQGDSGWSTTDYYSSSSTSALPVTSDFSVVAAFQAADPTDVFARIAGKGNGGANGWGITLVNTGDGRLRWGASGALVEYPLRTIDHGKWFYVVCTRSASDAKMYILRAGDEVGVLAAEDLSVTSPVTNSDGFSIGAWQVGVAGVGTYEAEDRIAGVGYANTAYSEAQALEVLESMRMAGSVPTSIPSAVSVYNASTGMENDQVGANDLVVRGTVTTDAVETPVFPGISYNTVFVAGQSNALGSQPHTDFTSLGGVDYTAAYAPCRYSTLGSSYGDLNDSATTTGTGPEVFMGRELVDREIQNPHIVKHAVAGSSLATHWARGTGLKLNTGSGTQWGQLVTTLDQVETATDPLDRNVVRGVLWVQGEADASSAPDSAAYEANLSALAVDFQTLVADMGWAVSPAFSLGVVLLSPTQTGVNATNRATIRTAQSDVAAARADTFTIDPDALAVTDGVHWDATGLLALGHSGASVIIDRVNQTSDEQSAIGLTVEGDSGWTATDYYSLPSATELPVTNDFSIAAAFVADDPTAVFARIAGKGSGGADGWGLTLINTGDGRIRFSAAGSLLEYNIRTDDQGKWFYVVCTRSATDSKMYVLRAGDEVGVLASEDTSVTAPVTNANGFSIGAWQIGTAGSGQYPAETKIAGVGYSSKELSEAEALAVLADMRYTGEVPTDMPSAVSVYNATTGMENDQVGSNDLTVQGTPTSNAEETPVFPGITYTTVLQAGQSNALGAQPHTDFSSIGGVDYTVAYAPCRFSTLGNSYADLNDSGTTPGTGPEVYMGRGLVTRSVSNPHIIKHAVAGSKLAVHWVRGTGSKLNTGSGTQWGQLVTTLDQVEAANNPLDRNVVRGVLWVQGEADAASASDSAAYQANLTSLIDDFQTLVVDMGWSVAPDFAFVVVLVSPTQTGVNATNGATIRAAANSVAALRSETYTIDPDALAVDDGVHWDATGLLAIGYAAVDAIVDEANQTASESTVDP